MKLTATQENILNAASNRSSGNIEPLPDNINAGIKPRVINGLLTRQLIEQSGDTYIISSSGYTAIGKQSIAEKPPHRKGTKQAAMIEMMRRPDGASIEEICAQTGWQKHTVRGVFSNALKKRLGLSVISHKDESKPRRYKITNDKS